MRAQTAASALCLALAVVPAVAEVINVDNAELARLLAAGVPLIDVRTEGEWQQTGIVAGSRLLTFFDARGQADPAAWLARAKAVADPAKPVAIICRTGHRSGLVSGFLDKQAGYKTVYNVTNGITGWIREGRTTTPAAQALSACATGGPC